MTAVAPRPSVPWLLGDVRTLFLSTTVGMLAVDTAWWGASGTGRLDHQVTWTVVAILGVVALGVGNFFWLLAGRRAVGSRLADVLVALELHADRADAGRAVAGLDAAVAADVTVVLEGATRYHRPSCLLVQGKSMAPATEQQRDDQRRCEMCRP